MNTFRILGALAIVVVLGATPATASLTASLTPTSGNPDTPRMGDRISFQTSIRNTGTMPEHDATMELSDAGPGLQFRVRFPVL